MPSLWLYFDRNHQEICGHDLPDAISWSAATVEDFLCAKGHPRVTDMVGYSEEDWGYLNEALPPDHQAPWTPDKCPWFPATEGLAMCATLRTALIETPEALNDYPGMGAELLADIVELERVLQRAAQHGAQFQFTLDT